MTHNTDVLRLNSSGAVVQTYLGNTGVDSFFGLDLDPDGVSFWTAAGTATIYRVNIATGAVMTQWSASRDGVVEVGGLTVFGEISQGGGNIPEPGTVAMTISGLGCWFCVTAHISASPGL